MPADRLVFRGLVHPWMCDTMGHLNVRHYTGLFDDCCWHVLAYLLPPQARGGKVGWVAATMTMDFVQEVLPGTALELFPIVTRIGSKSIKTRTEMRDASNGNHYATGHFVSILFDLEARSSMLLPDDVCLRAGQLLEEACV